MGPNAAMYMREITVYKKLESLTTLILKRYIIYWKNEWKNREEEEESKIMKNYNNVYLYWEKISSRRKTKRKEDKNVILDIWLKIFHLSYSWILNPPPETFKWFFVLRGNLTAFHLNHNFHSNSPRWLMIVLINFSQTSWWWFLGVEWRRLREMELNAAK